MKVFFIVFVSIFLAELGDKTQLATLLFATDKEANKWIVFLGASFALVTTSAIGVLAGDLISQYIDKKYLNYIAAIGFIVVGIFMLIKK